MTQRAYDPVMGQNFYVFDLDGTLADCQHRVHHLEAKDWRSFFAACPEDAPIPHVIDLLVLIKGCGHLVEIWSGRSDEVQAQTRDWLADHGIDPKLLTRMRRAGDHRPDDLVKHEMLAASIAEGKRPTAIFDDRDRVVAMWRAAGIPCFQVAPGGF